MSALAPSLSGWNGYCAKAACVFCMAGSHLLFRATDLGPGCVNQVRDPGTVKFPRFQARALLAHPLEEQDLSAPTAQHLAFRRVRGLSGQWPRSTPSRQRRHYAVIQSSLCGSVSQSRGPHACSAASSASQSQTPVPARQRAQHRMYGVTDCVLTFLTVGAPRCTVIPSPHSPSNPAPMHACMQSCWQCICRPLFY